MKGETKMKTLCLYFTRTNTTKAVMEEIAKVLNADIAEYTDGKDRHGFFGYVGACFATVNNTISTSDAIKTFLCCLASSIV